VDGGPEQALTGTSRAVVGTLLVAGWIGLTVLGSLLHLLAVVIRVRGGFAATMPVARPRLDSAIAAAGMMAIAALALAQGTGIGGLHDPAGLLLLAVYLVLGTRVAQLAGRVIVRARPRI
jgi:hypothetical protein